MEILTALRVEWRNSTPRFALLPERGNKNIKYLIFLKWESLSRLQSHACARAPGLDSNLFYTE